MFGVYEQLRDIRVRVFIHARSGTLSVVGGQMKAA